MESPVAIRPEPPARWHILPQAVHVLALRRAASASVRPPASAAAAADSGTRSPLGDEGPRARDARAFPGDRLAGPGEREFQLHAAPLSGRRRLGRLTASITFKWVVQVFRSGVLSDRSSRCAKSPRFDCLEGPQSCGRLVFRGRTLEASCAIERGAFADSRDLA